MEAVGGDKRLELDDLTFLAKNSSCTVVSETSKTKKFVSEKPMIGDQHHTSGLGQLG